MPSGAAGEGASRLLWLPVAAGGRSVQSPSPPPPRGLSWPLCLLFCPCVRCRATRTPAASLRDARLNCRDLFSSEGVYVFQGQCGHVFGGPLQAPTPGRTLTRRGSLPWAPPPPAHPSSATPPCARPEPSLPDRRRRPARCRTQLRSEGPLTTQPGNGWASAAAGAASPPRGRVWQGRKSPGPLAPCTSRSRDTQPRAARHSGPPDPAGPHMRVQASAWRPVRWVLSACLMLTVASPLFPSQFPWPRTSGWCVTCSERVTRNSVRRRDQGAATSQPKTTLRCVSACDVARCVVSLTPGLPGRCAGRPGGGGEPSSAAP